MEPYGQEDTIIPPPVSVLCHHTAGNPYRRLLVSRELIPSCRHAIGNQEDAPMPPDSVLHSHTIMQPPGSVLCPWSRAPGRYGKHKIICKKFGRLDFLCYFCVGKAFQLQLFIAFVTNLLLKYCKRQVLC